MRSHPSNAEDVRKRRVAVERALVLKADGNTLAWIAEQLDAEGVPCGGAWHAMRVSRLLKWWAEA